MTKHTPTPHVHVILICRLANDTSLTKWLWGPEDTWVEAGGAWIEHHIYALGDKPKEPPRRMCKLGEYYFPAPETVAPAEGTQYYVPVLRGNFATFLWGGDTDEQLWMASSQVHLNVEAATAHSTALQAVNMAAVVEAV